MYDGIYFGLTNSHDYIEVDELNNNDWSFRPDASGTS